MSKKTRTSSVPTEPSPESLAAVAEKDRAAAEALKQALDKMRQGSASVAEGAKRIEKELVRRKSLPKMPAVLPPKKL